MSKVMGVVSNSPANCMLVERLGSTVGYQTQVSHVAIMLLFCWQRHQSMDADVKFYFYPYLSNTEKKVLANAI